MRTNAMYKWLGAALGLALVVAISANTMADDKETMTAKARAEAREKAKAERAEKKRLGTVWKTMQPVDGFETVDLFKAMESGQVEVVLKPKSAANSNLFVTNKSDRPLAIKMPPAFAGVPVLRQIGGGGGAGGFGGGGGGNRGGGGQGGFGGGGGGQGFGGGGGGGAGGGGFGGGGRGGGGGGFGGGGGGGVFNIPPGRVGKASFKTFCLEHGKPDPKPRMDYTIAPLETLSSDPRVFELCRMVANDEASQNVLQAAAWNIANDLSWDFLVKKNRVERMDGYYERYFNANELNIASRVVAEANDRARKAEELRREKMLQKQDRETESSKDRVERELIEGGGK